MSVAIRGLKPLLRYGFAVMKRSDAEQLLEALRSSGAVHLVHINRIGKYVVVEINRAACMKECDVRCRDAVTGRKIIECESECIDRCVIDRLNTLATRVLSRAKEVQH